MRPVTRTRKILYAAGVLCVAAAALGYVLTAGARDATASTWLIQPLAVVVPDGKVVDIKVTGPGELATAEYVVDPHSRVCVHAILGDNGASRPYDAVLVYQDSGRSELNAVNLEIYETESDTYSRMEAKLEKLAGQTVKVTGEETVEGLRLIKFRAEQTADQDGRAVCIEGSLDASTGLVVREQRSTEDETIVLVRRVISREETEFGTLTRASLPQLAEKMRTERLQALAQANFEVLVLPDGEYDLRVMSVVPSGAPDYVRIDYETAREPGRSAAVIRIWDASTKPDIAAEAAQTLAAAEEVDLGADTVVSFLADGSVIQVRVVKELVEVSALELAKKLVDLLDSGLL